MHWGGEGEGFPVAASFGGSAARERCFGVGVSGWPTGFHLLGGAGGKLPPPQTLQLPPKKF